MTHHCSQFLHTRQTIPAMLSSNYIAATHNTIYSTAHQHAQHTAIPSPLPSSTLLCTQLTNTKHSWQNGTRCRDGVNVLWCRSHLVRLVFERSIPTCACFPLENFFVTLSYSYCDLSISYHYSLCILISHTELDSSARYNNRLLRCPIWSGKCQGIC